MRKEISIYTDGSCHPQQKIGGWAAIIQLTDTRVTLKGMVKHTTHQRMELAAALNALDYLEKNSLLDLPVVIYTDSQYLIQIQTRCTRLVDNNYLSPQGKPIRNVDLVSRLVDYLTSSRIDFFKVIAHQKKTTTENINRDADRIARSIVRENCK